MKVFEEELEKQPVKKLPDAPTKIEGADVLREFLLLAERPQKFSQFIRKKSK